MRFHNERDKRLHPMRRPQIDAPPLGNEKSVIRRRGTLAQRPPKRSQRSEYLLRGWVDDPAATPADLEALTAHDEVRWRSEREAVLLY